MKTNITPERRRFLNRLAALARAAKHDHAQMTDAARRAYREQLIAKYIPDSAKLAPEELQAQIKIVLSRRMKAVRRARTEKAQQAVLASTEAAHAPQARA